MNRQSIRIRATCALLFVTLSGCASAPVAPATSTASPAAPPVSTPVPPTVQAPIPAATPVSTPSSVPSVTPTHAAAPEQTAAATEASGSASKSLSGIATWGTKPTSGVRIVLRGVAASDKPCGEDAVAEAVTGANGEFTLANPPAGDYSLCAIWPDGEESLGAAWFGTIAAGQEVTGANVSLSRQLKMLEPAADAAVDVSPTLRWAEFSATNTFSVTVIDVGTTEAVLQQVVSGTSLAVTPPLKAGHKYHVAIVALGADRAELAYGDTEFSVAGVDAGATPDASQSADLPPSCQPGALPGATVFVGSDSVYCFMYPSRFKPGPTGVTGPALDKSAKPLAAALAIEVTAAPAGADLAAVVDGYLKEVAGQSASSIVRTQATIGGEPAEVLEGVPGGTGSRDVIVLHSGKRFVLRFTPSVKEYPLAKADVEELFQTVTSDFNFVD